METKKYTVKELAEATGKTPSAIYKMIEKLGRIPTLEEVKSVKNGRPPKKG